MISQRYVTAAKSVALSHENVRDYRAASWKLQRPGPITSLVFWRGRVWPTIRWACRTVSLERHQAFSFSTQIGSRREVGQLGQRTGA